MHDPIYAVGSFYVSGQVYPDKSIVEDAISNLTSDLDMFQRMQKGEKVRKYNSHYGRWIDDQRAFAGYTDQELSDNVADIEEIVSELRRFMQEDYPEGIPPTEECT
jgi:hypothetical protein